jgi:hypothetical protein
MAVSTKYPPAKIGDPELVILASSLQAATFNGADFSVDPNEGWKGILFFVNITANVGTGTLIAQLQAGDPQSGAYANVPGAVTPVSAGNIAQLLLVYPGTVEASASFNAKISYALPSRFRLVYTIGGTSVTFSVTGTLLR